MAEISRLGYTESIVPELMETAIIYHLFRIKSPVNFTFKNSSGFETSWITWRSWREKQSALVVYVNQKQRVLDLYHHKNDAGRGRKIWYSHSGLCASQRQQV